MAATVDDVVELVSRLPEVVEGTRYQHRSWSVGGRGFAWVRQFSKADLRRFGDVPPPQGPILAVMVDDPGDKEAVLATHAPSVFTIPHFDGFPAVLVQLDTVAPSVLAELIEDAWLACAPRSLRDAYLRRSQSPGQD